MERLHSCLHDNAFAFQFAHAHCARISRAFSSMKVGALGEDGVLDQILLQLPRDKKRKIFAGAADDCAVVQIPPGNKHLVLKTDCVVEGVHFVRGTSPSDVGWKAMMRPLSDFAATSALPHFALITLIVPEQTKVEWVERLYRGLRRAAKRFK